VRQEDAHRCALERPAGENGQAAAGDKVATRVGEEEVVAGVGVSASEGLGGAGRVGRAPLTERWAGEAEGHAGKAGGRGAERSAEMTAIPFLLNFWKPTQGRILNLIRLSSARDS
jgi:hypothetical protein